MVFFSPNVNICRFRGGSILTFTHTLVQSITIPVPKAELTEHSHVHVEKEENSIWKLQQRHSYFYLWKFITDSHNECV